jgi:hypothetical protein
MQGKLTRVETTIEEREDQGQTVLVPSYALVVDDVPLPILPEAPISLKFERVGAGFCQHCESALMRSYGGGYCYDCFSTLARCDLCIVSPERCHLHLGTCRDETWADEFCQQAHVVYLAISSGPKVGITRQNRLYRRWVDQGAVQAMAIAHVGSRRTAGFIETKLRNYVSDRTDWRKMVTGNPVKADLLELERQLRGIVPQFDDLAPEFVDATEADEMTWADQKQVVAVRYPVQSFAPAQMLKLDDSNPIVHDNLLGFMGGYVLLRSGVLPFSALSAGNVMVTIGEPLGALPSAPQMKLF